MLLVQESPRLDAMEHHQHHSALDSGDHSAAMAELLDLDAEVSSAYLCDVTAWVSRQAADMPRRILDLGAGTGTGTIALAQRFGLADVIALDASAEMLDRVRDKASSAGLADRVQTVQADLNAGWPAIEPVDLVWASSSLHHMADPAAVLDSVFAAISPGGLLAVTEMDAPPRFLPDDIGLGRPGLESRLHHALEQAQTGWPPSPDWGPYLEQARFAVLSRQTFTIDLKPPHTAPVCRYAGTYLRRVRPVLEGRLAGDDLTTLDALLASDGPDSLLRRGDLVVRGSRTAWAARRP
jgi:ubiquinone/menaquinone biosynthesis C-methylase UbiE